MAAETVDVIRYLGETTGFWIQTGAFVFSALGAIAIIYNNSHQAKKRATIDLVLHESSNQFLIDAKKEVSKYHDTEVNFTELSCGQNCAKPENGFIQSVLNNYEFIASGIKEGAFDEEIYKRMKRSVVIRDWKAFSGYIAELRRAKQRDKLYIEFEWLAKRWEKNEIQPEVHWSRRMINKLGI
ncbi:MAG: DUF4760 domain-containing protein [Gammaproteobacteria bacterium]|nr:DUF4760 domain-containing protein [Gammaproteobacteria bacterium]MBU1731046.1 DUF4760 domain-containing protein [Gammaproteobacteria bacterium]MBU1893706.1 DUF4760 domain-containing protein [Gammaproteobacteria bacterium]